MNPIKDKRYTITNEFTGHISGKPVFVARFCGEWIGSSQFYSSALMKVVGHKAMREGALVIQEAK
jgi:hypothetical protein